MGVGITGLDRWHLVDLGQPDCHLGQLLGGPDLLGAACKGIGEEGRVTGEVARLDRLTGHLGRVQFGDLGHDGITQGPEARGGTGLAAARSIRSVARSLRGPAARCATRS